MTRITGGGDVPYKKCEISSARHLIGEPIHTSVPGPNRSQA